MKVILVHQRYGHTRTFVIKGWLKGLLSLCLLGAPVALGYLGYQMSVQSGDQLVAQAAAEAPDEAQRAFSEPGLALLADRLDGIGTAVDSQQNAWPDNASLCLYDPCHAAPPAAGQLLVAMTVPAVVPAAYRHGRVVDPAAYLMRSRH